jgi:DNA-binding transcriptional LysR family regulator
MEFRNLETFVWVARLLNFRLAAERLHTTQPAVSARIAQLELELKTRLFDRKPRRIELTTAGAALLIQAETMLDLRSEMLASAVATAQRGRLRLGVPETIVHTWLPALVERITAEHTAVTVDLEVDSTPNLLAALIGDRLDLAFLHGQVPDQRFFTESLCDFPLGWFASPILALGRGKISLARCVERPIITHRRGSAPYAAVQTALTEAGLWPARLFGSSAIAGIVRLALDGIGVCVVSEAVVRREVEAGLLVALDVGMALPPVAFHVSIRHGDKARLAGVVARMAEDIARAHLAATNPSS